jgi:localization factor PodJL
MSGAQSWNVKGVDPKIREAAREAAARQGMSLAEYLNHMLATHQRGGDGAHSSPQQARPRVNRLAPLLQSEFDDDDDWTVGGRPADPARLAQRIESIERRTQLAVTGLDRAVSTIDRSVLGLAARIEDAEAVSTEAVERISQALEQFRAAGETLSGRLQRAESEAAESRRAFDNAASSVSSARERLEQQVAVAEEIARRAEAAASFLTSEMDSRETALAQTLAEARAVAEEAARHAAEASADAVKELRKLQDDMSERLVESETSTRRAIENAVAEVRTETANETRGAREALLEEVVRLEAEIAKRVGAIDDIKADHTALIARIERAEAGARESTAGLRQAAGAAIADLRNAQLTLTARVKQVEDIAGSSGAIDLTDLRHAQQDIAERLAALESKAGSPVADALAAFEARLASVESAKPESNELDEALRRLADRIAETESTANTAIRTLEETVSSLGARIEQSGAVQETEAVRALLEQRLDTMAQSVREELANQIQTALAGGEGMESALADVNRRLAAAERRQAQTIEAISIEIRRMSETVDARLRAVEARNDDAAAAAVREELSRMAATLEQRFDEIERREAAAFDRMGLEVGRLSERLEERVGAVEQRSAQAIEHVGEQVARMAERFGQRQEQMARELGERMLDSEERAGHRVSEAISSIMERLAEVEAHSQEAIAPVQKAVSSVASKLERFENGRSAQDEPALTMPTPARRSEDFPSFSGGFEFSDPEPEPYVSPMDAAQPVRAAPLPPRQARDDDIYYAEGSDDIDDLLEAVEGEEPFLPPADAPVPAAHATDFLTEDAPPPQEAPLADAAEDSAFWAPDRIDGENAPPPPADALAAEAATDAGEIELAKVEEPPLALDTPEDAPPPSKNDYLASARRAAQAQSLPKTRPEHAQPPKLSLRGSSRIVLWGAASLVTLLLAGGAYYLSTSNAEPETASQEPTPPAVDLHSAPAEPPAGDPLAEAPVEGAAPEDAAETSASPAPVAANDAPQGQPVVAGPLPARNVSLEQAAQSGDLVAQYELALQRIAAGRTQEGVAMMRRAGDRGFAMAQYRMAKIYERGEGVAADLTVARQWTERAAAAGNRRAMHDLGVYFARGEGAPLDEAAAFRWFRQAAELGVADSQYNLGVLYQQGRGVNASPTEALFWFSVAARQGDQDAAARATAVEAQLSPMQIEQARTRAQAFRPRAASAVANGEFGQRSWTRPRA